MEKQIKIKKSDISDFSSKKAIKEFLSKDYVIEEKIYCNKDDELFQVFQKLTFKNVYRKKYVNDKLYTDIDKEYTNFICFKYKNIYYAIDDIDFKNKAVLLGILKEK